MKGHFTSLRRGKEGAIEECDGGEKPSLDKRWEKWTKECLANQRHNGAPPSSVRMEDPRIGEVRRSLAKIPCRCPVMCEGRRRKGSGKHVRFDLRQKNRLR